MAEKHIRVGVRVHPTVREFIMETSGSDVIVPDRHDLLWKVVKANLVSSSENEVPAQDPQGHYLYIELMESFRPSKAQLKSLRKKRPMFALFQDGLTLEGERAIADELRKRFKESFHTFVLGALEGNPGLQQREAFVLFIERFKLSQNRITFEMLKKSWDRSDHKKSFWSGRNFPLILF